MSDLRGRATRNALSTGGAQAYRLLLQILSVVTLSRMLPPGDFGLMAMIAPMIAFVLLFGDLGLTQAVATAKSISPRQISAIFWINIAVAATLAVVLAALAPLAADFYGEPRLIGPMRVLAGTILLTALGGQHQGLIVRSMQFGRLAMIDMSAATAGFVAALIWASIAPSIWALVAQSVTASLVGVTGLWRVSRWRPDWSADIREASPLLRFGSGLMGFDLTNFLSRNLDNVIIGHSSGAAQLGYYDRAYKLLLFPLSQVNSPVGRVLVPMLARLRDDPERYRRVYLRTLQQLMLFTLPGVVFLLANAHSAIPTILGPQWQPSVAIFLWLGLAAIHQPISATTGWLFVSQQRGTEFAWWGLVIAITSIAAFLIGAPWGAVGVAAAYAISDLFIRAPIVWFWVGRRGPVRTRDLARLAAPNVLACTVMGFSQLFLTDKPISPWPLLDLAIRLPLAFAVAWGVLAIFPAGRAALLDLKHTALSLTNRAKEQTNRAS
ncbi:lipopolysaccharide biosynthesis protein [Sphingomonas crocodyli]|uniref:Lipopolysaccharide biosynthesis protein n=1 Tax=Sphingomonas crocodyli TaxID=1979270 RepID=A0A437M770_9SPHN|nr:lipopolysaccharide biosynthesis protein [Sphingomonas crocodyli]RVT93571.1 lipopolysaccharide biosynthesis protein [Sphingomonas crocodyli]